MDTYHHVYPDCSMSQWPSVKARHLLAVLLHLGWQIKRQSGSHKTLARNGWSDGWRNGIYPFLHFHTGTHEVLGIARGRATVEFGGAEGRASATSVELART